MAPEPVDETEWNTTVRTFMLIARLGRLHDVFLHEDCARHDLTTTDFRVLVLLRLSGEDNPVSPTVIGSWVIQTSGGLTATLRRLSERDLIELSMNPTDGRGRLVTITSKGVATIGALFADVIHRFAQICGPVDLTAAVDALAPLVSAYEQATGRQRSASLIGTTDYTSLSE